MIVFAAPEKKCPPPGSEVFLILAWLLLWCLCPGLLRAAEPLTPPALTLRSFRIEGAQTISARKVRKQMSMTLPSWVPLRKKPRFSDENLEADLEQLKLFYRTQGFYHTRITPEVVRRDGQVDVTLRIVEGPPIRVTAVELHGLGVVSEAELMQLQEQAPLRVGSRYSDDQYEELKRHYLTHFQNHGYFWSEVTGTVYLDPEANTARLVLRYILGPVCYFGDVKVEGEDETPPYLIVRKLAFKKGDRYSLAKIYDSQKNLYDTDLFQSASVMPGEVKLDQKIIPMVVNVQEKKKKTVKVGLGYGDEELFRGRLALRLRNVGGGGRMLDLETKYSAIDAKATATFTNPQIFASKFDFVASGGWVRRVLPSFVDQSYYTFARLERDLPWKIRGYFGHAFETARPYDVSLSTLILLENTQPGKYYKSSMAIFGLSQNTTVNPSDPTGGGKIILTGECATDLLGSSLDFTRTIAEVRRYHSIAKDVVFSGRLKFGIIQPIESTSQIPIQRRFFAGGYNSVRGYRLDYLGPRTPSGDPIGGDAVIEGNLELRAPLYKKFRAVGFFDYGNVFFKAANIDLGQLKYAAGFGVSYLTPIGPAGLYFAWPLNPIDPLRDTFRVHFTIGPSF